MKRKRRKIERSVAEWRDGYAVRWVYVIPAEWVAELVRRVSPNPNSQTHRALRALGIDPKQARSKP